MCLGPQEESDYSRHVESELPSHFAALSFINQESCTRDFQRQRQRFRFPGIESLEELLHSGLILRSLNVNESKLRDIHYRRSTGRLLQLALYGGGNQNLIEQLLEQIQQTQMGQGPDRRGITDDEGQA